MHDFAGGAFFQLETMISLGGRARATSIIGANERVNKVNTRLKGPDSWALKVS